VLDEGFPNMLHKRMYANVRRWAGKYRKSQKNIGIELYRISTELRALLDDCRYWVSNNSANLVDAGATRAAYVAALRAADNNDYATLFAFVRS
jgi:fido (protein-threonine AMPylation protein)